MSSNSRNSSNNSSLPSSISMLGLGASICTESGSSPNPIASLRKVGSSSASSFRSLSKEHSSSSGSTSEHESRQETSNQYGQSFTQMLQENPRYTHVSGVPAQYDVRLVHSTRGPLHWYILVQMLGSTLPFLTIEITTSNMTDLIPTMRTIDLNEVGGCWSRPPAEVGIYSGTLQDLCQFADAIVTEMGGYNLLVNNCQHFCNNLLQKLNFSTFNTTIGPQTTLSGEENNVDLLTTVLRQVYDKTLSGAPAGIGSLGAAVVGSAVGAPSAIRATLRKQDNKDESKTAKAGQTEFTVYRHRPHGFSDFAKIFQISDPIQQIYSHWAAPTRAL